MSAGVDSDLFQIQKLVDRLAPTDQACLRTIEQMAKPVSRVTARNWSGARPEGRMILLTVRTAHPAARNIYRLPPAGSSATAKSRAA